MNKKIFLNNKGFAITTILYGLLIIFCLLLVSILGILESYRNNLKKLIENTNGAREIITIKSDSSTGAGRSVGKWIDTPIKSYTGNYELIDENNGNWSIKFLTSGELELESDITVDIFLIGGGGSGSSGWGGQGSSYEECKGGSGGSGGSTNTVRAKQLKKNQKYNIIVGQGDGGTTTAFELTAAGGTAGGAKNNGSRYWGGYAAKTGKDGVYAFGEKDYLDKILYGAAGGGGGCYDGDKDWAGRSLGGYYGGGNGAVLEINVLHNGGDGIKNSGSGGGGASVPYYNSAKGGRPGKGGSGIVIIRNAR